MLPVQLYQGLVAWMRDHQLACPVKSWTGFSCPGCGMQRSAIAWFEGNWMESWQIHPGVWLGWLLIALIGFRHQFPLRWRKPLIVSSFVGYLLVMIIRYMYLVVNQ